MEDLIIKKYFEDFSEKLDDLKTDLEKYDERQRSQYKKVIIIEERQKTMRKNIRDHKISMRWFVGLAVPIMNAAIIILVNIYLLKR